MATKRTPKTLKLTETSQKRDDVVFIVDDEEVSFEIKLPSELGLGDYEELQRVMESWVQLDKTAPEDRLTLSIRLIRRMIDIFFFDKVPREVVDSLDWDKMESLSSFLEERFQMNVPQVKAAQVRGRKTAVASR
jgi:hypothetical protein